jgi:hypothetical protein
MGDTDEGDSSTSEEEAIRRVYDHATYTTPFPPMTEVHSVPLESANHDNDHTAMTEIGAEEMELEHFLDRFCVREKTEEIVDIMRTTPSLKTVFEALVPTEISYVDFWTRFYFRCDPDRIRRLRRNAAVNAGARDSVDRAATTQPHDELQEDEPVPASYTRHQRTERTCISPTNSSPTSVADQHFEFDDHALRTLSMEGL